jgi:DNA-repair protein complementing XP-A cells
MDADIIYTAPSLDSTENPKCKECSSMDLDPVFFNVFHIYLCPTCKEKFPEKYSLITKTEAKEDYLLTDRMYYLLNRMLYWTIYLTRTC